ncbi:TIGR04084 family radical SAM/SPASM domain-containing protein [Candidatus Pyrohabitans sp.]
MHYHLLLTQRCNLKCSYCGGTREAEHMEVEYSIEALRSFIAKDPSPVIAFYGGEPLLRLELMEQVMDAIPARYILHTNGVLLHKVKPSYLRRFHTVLISIDGRREVTDAYRGRGVYDRIIKNARRARRHFRGDLIARMVASLRSDIYEDVLHLARLGIFDHVHWQLDFELFWDGGSEIAREWLRSYNAGITKLVREWVSEMQRGELLGLVPFIGITKTLLTRNPAKLRCGAGVDFFAISPSGDITLCPVTPEYEFMRVGSIFDTSPEELKNCACLQEPCASCDLLWVCGGRCLFINLAKEWVGERGYALICSTVRHLVGELSAALPEIKRLIEEGVVSQEAFSYPEINNDCEVVP